ncbi:F-box/WD repeat containing protein pof1 [Pyrenophora tritici-repentis]|uniref:F-box/WD repeat containing protein pof1 n=2 Tax=Pyrenophora tritici-repentis TaxID=45151 RepID=A0A317A021_9PLEO|nr:F-box/WD repeat containing protein pof1 [Pyrenophora tritici-repentis Pt-1C-BFP]EDU50693.1 F-box/WD repeat containing protein pof1 [Pyrenophora tritici-repentis Pt-1C-BFP]KAI1515485.1 F-box/WD repeat containing protein pof1 [Pyrenophora tritici-repentis]KAI1664368.1 F-box/WD repeat containing protein pof1 [Pyrenophora tritici-repentis]KAI1678469.1 F-box/WD repeat containing protein pof1 [Pyrenophora tritici-repentis]
MVKSYSKYEQTDAFGVVATATSNIVWTPEGLTQPGSSRAAGAGRAYAAANEEVLCWDIKKSELVSRWRDNSCTEQVTVICRSDVDPDVFAVGYTDGSIRIWDARTSTVIISFNGHKSAVTVLTFDQSGVRLASGSKDTDIVIWDLVSETGLFKLRGHKGQITGLHFLHPGSASDEDGEVDMDADQAFLLSTSKDALIKIWDVATQHCIETHIAQTNGECWALGVSPDGSGCITAGNDGELKVWAIDQSGLRQAASTLGEGVDREYLTSRGILYRQGKDRTQCISFYGRADYIAVHGAEKAVEIWRIKTPEEVRKSLVRKRKRKREKSKSETNGEAQEGMDDDKVNAADAEIGEVFVPYVTVRTAGKVRSVAWMHIKGTKKLQLLVGTNNNLLDVYEIPQRSNSKSEEAPDYSRTLSVELSGHRNDVRALALSSDDRMLASASSGGLKIWNIKTQNCLRTLECGYALCCAFLPGDKIVVVGTKDGYIELYDIAASTLLDKISAHEGAVWTMQVHPDGKSLITGSADKSVKFWNFDIVEEEIPGTKRTTPRLKLTESRILKVNDDVLSIQVSPDSRLLAVATLDNTVKVFFVDSLKLFLNLYGHKLPVLNMSISGDSKLIATCSADKNVRIWGLDFGDCHKALFGHEDSIMQISFIPHPVDGEERHIFFSASKDRTIKSWDGDKFQQIQKFRGHHGEIWAMTVARTGDFLVTASHDKSLRIWTRSDEPIFLEEERERELEEMYEKTLATSLEDDENNENPSTAEAVDASKQTITTLTAGERIQEALDLGIPDLELVQNWEIQRRSNPKLAPPQRNPLYLALGNISAERHVLSTMAKIPAAQLHDALLVLPFSSLPALFTFLAIWVRKQWNVTLTCRVLFFMLKTHQKQIVASRELKTVLEAMRNDLRIMLSQNKDLIGFNVAALRFVGEKVEERGLVRWEDVERVEEEEGKGRRKRGFVDVA